ncbi:GMC oxidoreductase [Streptomyces sp. NPDC017529]|uniref:GMC oxidoreductase n=1 Tax=Streptomyces sp. NPDC017529 TaxID=3365000 RepID=UPI0037994F99
MPGAAGGETPFATYWEGRPPHRAAAAAELGGRAVGKASVTNGTGPPERVDALVVGSGFGGSVAACRLAEAGLSVVVMERGRAYPPGSFPRTPAELGRALWDPGEGLYGLFDVWRFRGCDSLVSSGLGGGSLIYANVLLRKEAHWFVQREELPGGGHESWPLTRADLDPHYDAVEAVLRPVPYPVDAEPYAGTPKTRALRDAAERAGLPWSPAPLAVSFSPGPGAPPGPGLPLADAPYGNLHGVPRSTCGLTGACDFGCNNGAKNTLDHTYLSAARQHGADLRTGHQAVTVEPLGSGYRVGYVVHDTDGGAVRTADLPRRHIDCDRLVLAAGTYGTVHMLLSNRARLPGLGPALGTRFCGNGDLLTFLYGRRDAPVPRPDQGPVITGVVGVPGAADGGTGRGHIVQDGGYPGFLNWLAEGVRLAGGAGRLAAFAAGRALDRALGSPDGNMSGEIAALLGPGGGFPGVLPLLGVGRDVPDGVMGLRDGRLDIRWTTATSRAYYEGVRTTMRQLAAGMGAGYLDNPIWWWRRVVTVHPVGGAPIGDRPEEAVCDPYGEVFGHPRLYVADAAALPGPVGVNPSLTIAALADRMCTRLLENRPPRRAHRPAPAPATALSFAEVMRGALADGPGLTLRLTITVDDVDAFVDAPDHRAAARGEVDCEALGGRLPVRQGWFNLFVPSGLPGRRRMLYHLHLDGPRGRELTLTGRKEVGDDPGPDLWADTTTLAVEIRRGRFGPGEEPVQAPLCSGVVRVGRLDFVRQLASMRATGPAPFAALSRFGRFFAGELWDVYGPGR